MKRDKSGAGLILGGVIMLALGVSYLLLGEFRWEIALIACGIYLILGGVLGWFKGWEVIEEK